MVERRRTKQIKVGNTFVGSDHQISVQSMLNISSHDIKNSVIQARELEKAGCEIIRIAIPDKEALDLIPALKNEINVPIVADIHFDYRLALESIDRGIDKIRINPGNIGSDENVKKVADSCRQHNIPIRIGVNSGSLEKNILNKYGGVTPEAMVESAMYHVDLLNKFDFDDIVISIKSSDVEKMIKAYRLIADKCNYPLHLGVTEAGTYKQSLIKSCVGIGSLLLDGIGDTIRVSMTDKPIKEVESAIDILKALSLKNAPTLVSCPTCGRTKIDLISLANEVEERLKNCTKPIKVAVMGCVVNGPGEAHDADVGIAGGDGCAILFKKGEIVKKISEEIIVDELMKEIEKL
ncbi:MAG: flavodoxin-dependent (E)-4-hydroxy-3-methylbut-2-enyl-diphosphate synthase [Clostridia bacterium]|nr:flavodoxin-dependent (E)-4-hydroxy-3-methylbut-2-enyl-diphosphate synthase [Clostridia bacterium]